MEKGKFITIEGTDGAGKSTFVPEMKAMLEAQGYEVILTREPGGTPFAEELREIILNKPMDRMTALLLAFASRNEHIENVIKPALEAGKYVISDRFTDSTYAYQCAAKGFPESSLKQLETIVQGDTRPGLTFVFDVPLAVSKERLARTGKVPDKFESEDDAFKERVYKGYKNLVKKHINRCKLIDSSQSIEATREQVLLHLDEFFLGFKKKKQMKP